MKQNIISKYNIPVPRYTSYPPANYFHSNITQKDYIEAIGQSNYSQPSHISFYLHIPFCRHLCHYCGCNSFPMTSKDNIAKYINALKKEIQIIKPLLAKDRKIAQIHYGGGTPTVLPIEVLKELNETLMEGFNTIDQPEIAIECHPGYLDEKYWQGLSQAHFNRFSIGVQDFDLKVLKTVNRHPSLLPIEVIFEILREAKARINMDFIYGLPYQTVDSFTQSINKAISLQPDRLVTFSYAHVPWVSKRQLILEKSGLPLASTKKEMFEQASKILQEANYKPIGMDHFVKEQDELYKAVHEHQLHRNFQGYCTRRTTGQVYAFGVTGISQLSSAYTQNVKTIEEYISKIEKGELPIFKGYQLSDQEQITRTVIEALMCNYRINWDEISQLLQRDKEDIFKAIRYHKSELQEYEKDGIITFSDEGIQMTYEGRLFVRNIAASLDYLMENTTKNFSKPV